MAARHIFFRLFTIMMVLVTGLSGCTLDKEVELRQKLSGWVYLAQTKYFISKMNCTVAVFDLARPEITAQLARVRSMDTAVERVGKGQVIVFKMENTSPNVISEQLMSRNLGIGLGMLSTGVGPAKDCMEDAAAQAYYTVLMSPLTRTVYDPSGNAILLVYPPENLAFFLRGNI